MVGERLSSQIGQPVVYENRSGASGSIAAEYIARAARRIVAIDHGL
jgi:tripartite-type tricarboxylate transporter receptor subunit TctC